MDVDGDGDGNARGPEHDGGKSNTNNDNDNDNGSTEVNPEAVDQMMARQIGMLGLRDRNAIYEEIHGVFNMAIDENPELVAKALRSFDTELAKLDPSARIAYDAIVNHHHHQQQQQPQQQDTGNNIDLPSKKLLLGERFRLRFLRSAFFDSKKAVDRMVGFLDSISALYGSEALPRFDESMNFFIDTKETQAGLRFGYLQLLPFRDRAGRRIVYHSLDSLDLKSEIRLKIFLYLAYVAGHDVETQRNGILLLFWPGVQELRLPESSHRSLVAKVVSNLPTRTACFHFCFPDTPFYKMARAMLTLAMARNSLHRVTRVKWHSGNRTELLYELMGYGIPVSLIPNTGTGTLKNKTFLQWIKAQKVLEIDRKHGSNDGGGGGGGGDDNDGVWEELRVECPCLRDVLFRSAGKSCMLHPGNVALRSMFEQYHDEHVNAGQTEKKNLVWKIVREVESRGGRFMTWDKRSWWIVLKDRAEIRSKVAISLRDYNKQRKPAVVINEQQQASHNSSTYAFVQLDGKRRKQQSGSGEECCFSNERTSATTFNCLPCRAFTRNGLEPTKGEAPQ